MESAAMSDDILSRFLRYVRVDTQSNEKSNTFPSTAGQLVLLEMLKRELIELGASDVLMTRHGYVMASIPANTRKAGVPTVAFLAHVDTAPDCSGHGVNPIVHRRYNGSVITFPDNSHLTLDPATSPELRSAIGKDIVTASGTTLLGSDDKSGVAVVMTLVERLLRETKRKHGLIRVCFTPDEEIGRGVDKLNLQMLGADFGYTLDGGPPGEICWETFSGDAAEVIIDGVTTHTMEARAKGMVNAVYVAGKLLSALPRERCAPETTEAREGFIHPTSVEGRTERAIVKFILRDFELNGLEAKREILRGLCRGSQAAEPRARIRCKIRKQYRNMAYWLRNDMRPVELAREAFAAAGLKPFDHVIRGGTDGSRLTELGLPTPNLFCGEHNAHGPLEWVAIQDMESAVTACTRLAELWERKG
ncbi:MAG TPA: peptidase T [Candidatus Udaeobacter sp.]|jgi:tripeptide aminopeptidase|nr:peptidase T [Candidatus Udaeobacter sp.]